MKKRLFSCILSLMMVCTLLPATVLAGSAHEHNGIVFEEWADTTALPDSKGNYYLANDVELTDYWTVPAEEEVNLCLNGHIIKQTKIAKSVIFVPKKTTLNIYDDTTVTHKFKVESKGDKNGLWTLDEANGDKILTGGCITGGSALCGGGIVVGSNDGKGTLNIYGGNIVGNIAGNALDDIDFVGKIEKGVYTKTGKVIGSYIYTYDDILRKGTIRENMYEKGGGIFAYGDVNMYGGSVTGNIAFESGEGGGIYCTDDSTFAMHGGIVQENKAAAFYTAGYGGGVHTGGFIMDGGEIKNNISTKDGGGVYVTNGISDMCDSYKGKVELTGGEISENIAAQRDGKGGGVYIRGNFTLGGDIKITGNTRDQDGTYINSNLYLQRGNVKIRSGVETVGSAYITFDEDTNAPKSGMSVGVTCEQDGNISTNGQAGYTDFVKADDATTKKISFADDKLRIDSGVFTPLFDACGGTMTIGDNGYPKAEPTKKGYTFAGWYDKPIFGEKKEINNMVSGATYYAYWKNAYGNLLLQDSITVEDEFFMIGTDEKHYTDGELSDYGITFTAKQTEPEVSPAKITLNNAAIETEGLYTGKIIEDEKSRAYIITKDKDGEEIVIQGYKIITGVYAKVDAEIEVKGHNVLDLLYYNVINEVNSVYAEKDIIFSGTKDDVLSINLAKASCSTKAAVFAEGNITNYADIEGTNGVGFGIFSAGTIDNSGILTGESNQLGVVAYGKITNSGTINGKGTNAGVWSKNSIENMATGIINAESTGSPWKGEQQVNAMALKATTELINSGKIVAKVTGNSNWDSIGLCTKGNIINNSGATIEASANITVKKSQDTPAGISQDMCGFKTITNSGTISCTGGYGMGGHINDSKIVLPPDENGVIECKGAFYSADFENGDYTITGANETDIAKKAKKVKLTSITKDAPITICKKQYTVTYDGNGNGVTKVPLSKNTMAYVTKPMDNPERADYKFGGWYDSSTFEKAWNFNNDYVRKDTTLYARWIKNDVDSTVISGTVTKDTAPVADAVVELRIGKEIVATTVTGSDGTYAFPADITSGEYNIVVTDSSEKVKTALVNFDSTTGATQNVNMPVNSSVVELTEDAPDTMVGGLDSISTAINASVKLVVDAIPADSTDSSQAAIKALDGAKNKNIQFVDMSLMKEQAGSYVDYGSDNNELLKVVILYDMSNKNDISVMRYHNGEAKELTQITSGDVPADGNAIIDKANNRIIIFSSKFSTYAIGYTPRRSGGGGSSIVTSSTVKTPTSVKNGSISVSPKSPKKGETVTVNATPDKGYEVDKLTVKDSKGKIIDITDASDGKYTFTMPDGTVSIDIAFKETESETDDKTGEETDDETDDEPKDIDSDSASTFTDVKESDWFYNQVKYVYDNKLMLGVTDTEFAPNMPVTRAMFVTVLYRMEEEPDLTSNNVFTDVESGKYYENAVIWAQGNEIVKGISKTEYAPNMNITREQMAAIIYRYAKFKGIDTESVMEDTNTLSHNDIFKVSEYAKEAMNYCIAAGIITGDNNGNLNPQNNATRAEFATILMKVADIIK